MSGKSLIFSIVYLIFKCCLIRQRPAPLGTSNRKAHCQVAFFLFFGMSHVLTYMLLKTLGRWLTGSWNVVISSLTLSLTLLCCTTAMTWPTYSVPVTGYHLLMTPLFPGRSPLVLEWRPIRSFLPRLKWFPDRRPQEVLSTAVGGWTNGTAGGSIR